MRLSNLNAVPLGLPLGCDISYDFGINCSTSLKFHENSGILRAIKDRQLKTQIRCMTP